MKAISVVSDRKNYSFVIHAEEEIHAEQDECERDGSFYLPNVGSVRLNGSVFIEIHDNNQIPE